MRKFTTLRTTLFLNFCFICSMLFYCPVLSKASNTEKTQARNGYAPKVELSYGFSDRITAGETFAFTININKEADYQYAGEVALKWIEGFVPQNTHIDGTKFSISNNMVVISWDKLPDSHLIPLSFNVKTSKNLMGVYPVQVFFKDALKYTITDNIGVYVANKRAPIDNAQIAPESLNHIQISLDYPDEILFTETYTLNINIIKGKNTGSAKITVQLPPFSNIQTKLFNEYLKVLRPGTFIINIPVMPASPNFTIQCSITNNSHKKSIYPIKARVEFSDYSIITFDDYVFITDQKTAPNRYSGNTYQEKAPAIDTTSIFSELDKLLDAWTKSTQGTIKKDSMNITGTSELTLNNGETPKKREQPGTGKILSPSDTPATKEKTPLYYAVQIAASKSPMPNLDEFLRSMRIQEPLHEDYDGEFYRYLVGDFQEIEEAKKLKEYLMKIGFPDAFGIIIENNERKQVF